jgi:sensitive to high expression protein 9
MLYHVSRSIVHEISPSVRQTAARRLKIQPPAPTSFICIQCRLRTTTARERRIFSEPNNHNSIPRQVRQLASQIRLQKEEKPNPLSDVPPTAGTSEAPPPVEEIARDGRSSTPSLDSPAVPDVHVVPDEDLPSHREKLRWRLSRRFNQIMDDLMPKLALASQRINTYTGTDYTSIEALRKEIIDQGAANTHLTGIWLYLT